MKKLMLGMAIAAVGSAFAVESSNIVGYKTQVTASDSGFTQIAPVFDSVSKANVTKLSDLTFTPQRNDNIQIFNEIGDAKYTLTYSRKGNKTIGYTYYWELADFTVDPDDPAISEIEDFEFPRGGSMWLQFADPIDFTESGAVNTNSVSYVIPGDGAFVQAGNCRPVQLKLSEIQYEWARNDNIQIFNEVGDAKYTLTYSRKGNKTIGYTYYWELADFTVDPDDPAISEIDPAEYVFEPGQHFWFSLGEAGTLTIPGVSL